MINREKELNEIKNTLKSTNAELINFYGRRRIGKTEILKHIRKDFLNDFHVLYYVFSEKNDLIQLEELYESFKALFPEQNSIHQTTISNWEDFFISIFKFDSKLVVLLDEFSNLVRINKSIPSIIQNVWDEYNKKSQLKLIVCGSIISIMRDLTAGERAFYGRAKSLILKPMRFSEIGDFFPSMSYENKIVIYSLFSGIPAYLEVFSEYQELPLRELLIKQPFAKLSIFKQELLTEIQLSIKKPSTYLQILFAISRGKHTFSKISEFVKVEVKNITNYLNLLIEIGLIERINPFTKKKLIYYTIKDNYTKFWFKFFYPYKNELELYSPAEFVDFIVLPMLNEYMGKQFELFCQEYLQELSLKNILPGLVSKIHNYQNELIDGGGKQKIQLEIDIIAETINKEYLYIAECKWWTKEISNKEVNNFLKKVSLFSSHNFGFTSKFNNLVIIIFSKNEITPELSKRFPDIKFLCLKEMEKYIY